MAVASKTAHAAVAIRTVLEGLGYGVAGATPLLGDNKAVRDIMVKNGASAKTRHFERVTMTVKRFYQQLVVVPYLVGTKHMAADIYTKQGARPADVLPAQGLHPQPRRRSRLARRPHWTDGAAVEGGRNLLLVHNR